VVEGDFVERLRLDVRSLVDRNVLGGEKTLVGLINEFQRSGRACKKRENQSSQAQRERRALRLSDWIAGWIDTRAKLVVRQDREGRKSSGRA
jgi:dGTP triphosphohydrolase